MTENLQRSLGPRGFAVVALLTISPGCTDSVPTTPVDAEFGPSAIAPDGVTFVSGDGRRFSCTVEISSWDMPVGSAVRLEVDNSMDLAGQVRGPRPSIVLNLVSLGNTPIAGQIFIFMHECGHVNSPDVLDEVAANCWAARRLSSQQVLSESEWEIVHRMLLAAYPFRRGPYPSGADQWAQLQTCLAA